MFTKMKNITQALQKEEALILHTLETLTPNTQKIIHQYQNVQQKSRTYSNVTSSLSSFNTRNSHASLAVRFFSTNDSPRDNSPSIYRSPELNSLLKPKEVLSLGWYFPSGRYSSEITEDLWSNIILSVKNHRDHEKQNYAIQKLKDALLKLFTTSHLDLAIAVVPSSTKGNQNHGITKLARLLSKEINVTDGTACLERLESIPKATTGGSRQVMVHQKSIGVRDAEKFNNKTVLLLDDVLTTGNSISVCEDKLLMHGAKCVSSLVLGKTCSEKVLKTYKPNSAEKKLRELVQAEGLLPELIQNYSSFNKLIHGFGGDQSHHKISSAIKKNRN